MSKVFIGLEIHIELKTNSKMFCRCRADYFGKLPNSHVCPVCLGLPGALPFPNQKAIEQVITTGLALNCQMTNFSKFDRKNYFYPDLPKGYQISQYDLPLCQRGEFQGVRVRRVHLEEDTGKLFHETVGSEKVTLIDFNRSGVPLMEIVTEPDLRSPTQTKDFLKNLQQLVRSLKVADADMEKGQMRCEPTVNLEIEEKGKKYYTPLVEIKNINSFRFAEKAIEYEIQRQQAEFSQSRIEKQPGNKTTRGWDQKKQQTVLQREKEEAADYRYFPEPDIPPIRLAKDQIERIKKQLPELPEAKIEKLKKMGLSDYQAKLLSKTDTDIQILEEGVRIGERVKVKIAPSKIADLIINKKVKTAKEIIDKLSVEKPKMKEEELLLAIDKTIEDNPSVVEQFKKGKTTVVEFLVGQVMAKTKGQADPQKVREILHEKLKSS
ncbi:Asp-tRNA(Asn)/Glu-tRNA(Gln) amidotransferase subunit GatB [Candidatus Shapirobacteria bacterium]|nr:Asp-tRNA(Asn)/Glu-tRNA(Gln) amidotransferase subunit GatB [Candidatus Shapirobacteria bacterium]